MPSIENNQSGWDYQLAQIIELVDSDELPGQLVTGLSTLVSFAMASVFIYRGKSRPICIYDNFPPSAGKTGIENYVNGSYVLNPVYLAHLNGMKQGAYRIRDLAPDNYFTSGFMEAHKAIAAPEEEISYVTEGWPKGYEELDIMVPIDDVTVEFAMYKSGQDGGFSEIDVQILSSYMPVIGAIVRKFWQLRSEKLALKPRDASIDEIYANFGTPDLSQREREVIQYVLRGHSSGSIALNLDVSITTIKTHRKRAYSKLKISSQSELFSMFLNCVKSSLG